MEQARLRLAVRVILVTTRSALAKARGEEASVTRHRAQALLDDLASEAPTPFALSMIERARHDLEPGRRSRPGA